MITLSVSTTGAPKAFVVGFREMERWSVNSFFDNSWGEWSKDAIKPLSSVLRRRREEVARDKNPLDSLTFLTLHFDGEMEPRDLRGKTEFKGRLFFARPGDVVFSKIDVRNGAIGIVPTDYKNAVVTSEFPVYEVSSEASPDYVKLLFRTAVFRRRINSLISGASGRKRVEPDQLEALEVPLPPLPEQRAIVGKWEKARATAEAARRKVEEIRAAITARFLADLGLTAPKAEKPPKCFTAQWRDFERWSVSANQARFTGVDLAAGKYPLTALGEVLEMVQYGTSEKANTEGRGVPVLRMNNIVEGLIDARNLKHIELEESEMRRLLLKEGDILFNRTNSKELVGKCAVFHEKAVYVFASYLIRVRTCAEAADPDYIAFALNSPIGRQQIDAMSRQIIGQANVNSEELRSLRLPLPPLPVQREIVARVEKARAEIAKQTAIANATQKATEAELEEIILGSLQVRKRDKVLFGRYSGTEVRIDDEEHIITGEDNILWRPTKGVHDG